ncbi:MAG: UDP-N-acetylglucosamine 2-epimerase [Nitrospira bacterium SG8_35_4]|nr:MAG: UDP-N-acetylglucosamine 2-epimerase [Nitrospira bacterium SG8_35_4]
MKIINVVGARPNFMKIAPIIEEMRKNDIEQILVHTGQHYDSQMSKLFFDDLKLPKPDIDLEVGSGSHAQQTAEIMKKFETVLLEYGPDYILVVGDVNSTIACALTASKLGIRIIHVEAGLRSFDRSMPEEINRILTDALSDYLFITEKGAHENLLREGISDKKIFFVGNVMIDTLLKHRERADRSEILSRMGIKDTKYILVTLHRPSNVDNHETLERLLSSFNEISHTYPLVFPCHPRTRSRIEEFKLERYIKSSENPVSVGINLCDPVGYLDFVKLMTKASLVLTDSGGIQEETTILGVPCITLRENTERPVTVADGTNQIVGTDKRKIIEHSSRVLNGNYSTGRIPDLWDGRAAQRIVKVLQKNTN